MRVTDLTLEPAAGLSLAGHLLPPEDEYVSVVFLRSGSATVTHRGQRLVFIERSAALLRSPNTATATTSTRSRTGIVSVPLRRLLPYTPAPCEEFVSLGAATVRLSPFFGFLEALTDIVTANAIPAEPTATVLTELVAALVVGDTAFRLPGMELPAGTAATASGRAPSGT